MDVSLCSVLDVTLARALMELWWRASRGDAGGVLSGRGARGAC